MSSLAPACLYINTAIAALALAALYKLGGESSFGSHTRSARELANKVFDQVVGDFESTIAPLVSADIIISTQVIVPGGDPPPEQKHTIRINERFRNAIDNYLTDDRELFRDYLSLRRLGSRCEHFCRQLRLFTPVALGFSIVGALLALLETTGLLTIPYLIHLAFVIMTSGSAAGWLAYATRLVLERNPFSELESRYAHL